MCHFKVQIEWEVLMFLMTTQEPDKLTMGGPNVICVTAVLAPRSIYLYIILILTVIASFSMLLNS